VLRYIPPDLELFRPLVGFVVDVFNHPAITAVLNAEALRVLLGLLLFRKLTRREPPRGAKRQKQRGKTTKRSSHRRR
jgi:hypothetical protein